MGNEALNRVVQAWLYPARDSRVSRTLWGLLAVTLAVAVVAVTGLQRSLAVGRLSAPDWYDDVVYLFNAQQLLHDAPHQPILTTLYQVLNEHALIPVLLGSVGFLLLPGSGLLGPYILDSVVLFGALTGCAMIMRKMPVAAIAGILFAVSATPLASLTITEFRPDFAWGLSTALAVVAVLSINPFTASRGRVMGLGLLLGFALISKPSAVPATVATLAVAVAGALWHHWREAGVERTIRVRLGRLALLGASAALLVMPVYVIVAREIYAYIITGLVTIRDQNAVAGDFYFQWTYYLLGDGGKMVLGSAVPVCLLGWLASLVALAVLRRSALPRCLILLAALAVSYAAPSWTPVKTLFLGASFYSLLILSTVFVVAQAWEAAASTWPNARVWPLFASLALVAGAVVLIHADLIEHPTGFMEQTPERRKDLTAGTAEIWHVLKDHALAGRKAQNPADPSWVMVLTPEPITAGWISLYSEMEDVPLRGLGAYYARTLDELHGLIGKVDYVVVGNTIQYQLFGARLGDAFMAEMDASPDFHCIGSYRRLTGELINIYERNSIGSAPDSSTG